MKIRGSGMAVKEINRILSEVNGLNKKDRTILLRKMEKIYSVPEKKTEDDSLQSVFGIWKDYDIDKAKLREIAWRKN